ncbi:hypothetical protein ABIF53_001229 [Bradyrhizobium japonicum]
MIFRILEDQFAQKIRESKDADRRFMQLALALGRRGQGRTWPNPAVGAVIVERRRHRRPRLDAARRTSAWRARGLAACR